MLILEWGKLDVQSRELVCEYAAVSLSVARRDWKDIEPWLRYLLSLGIEQRSYGRAGLELE